MANEFLTDLGTAMNLFNSGVQQLHLTRTVNEANEAVAQIRESEASDAEQRKALRNLANQLALQLQGSATPTQIQQVSQAITPQVPQTAQAALVQGAAFGETDLQAAALTALTAGKKKAGTLSDKEIATITDLDNQTDLATKLFKDFEANRNFVGKFDGSVPEFLVGKDQVRFRNRASRIFQQLRTAITGAQASDKELDRLEELTPSVSDTEEAFEGKVLELISIAKSARARTLQNLRLGGKDTLPFETRSTGTRRTGAIWKNRGQ